MDWPIPFILIALLTLVTAYEMALFSVRPEHCRTAWKRGDSRGVIVMSFLRSPTKIISSLQIVATFLSLSLGAYIQTHFVDPAVQVARAAGLNTYWSTEVGRQSVLVISTILILVVTNLIPKRLAYAYADPLSLKWAKPVHVWYRMTAWLSVSLAWVSDGILKLFRVPLPKGQPVLEEDIDELLRQGKLSGTIDENEAAIIHRAFDLSEAAVTHFMTPRPKIVALNLKKSDAVLRQEVRDSERSQFVAIDGELDEFIGVVRARDVLSKPEIPIRELVRPVAVIPPNATALDLLQRFKEESVRAAIIVGDHGRVLGMATFNDFVSVVVGETQAIA